MKKKYFGSDDIISVYKFMDRCGLHCDVESNICVSHEIMIRKLKLRKEKFPDKIIVPETVPFKLITKEDVKTGKIILVKDDTKQVRAYHIPRTFIDNMTSEEKEEVREKLMDEYQSENNSFDSVIKKGYMKYLYRKAMKEALMKEELSSVDNDYVDTYEEYTPNVKVNRLIKIDKRRRY